jgi:aminomethyltransferase
MLEQGIPRQGCAIWKEKPVGSVTSGSYSPMLKKNIGLGFVPTEHSEVGEEFLVEIRDRKLRAKVVETPFYRRNVS